MKKYPQLIFSLCVGLLLTNPIVSFAAEETSSAGEFEEIYSMGSIGGDYIADIAHDEKGNSYILLNFDGDFTNGLQVPDSFREDTDYTTITPDLDLHCFAILQYHDEDETKPELSWYRTFCPLTHASSSSKDPYVSAKSLAVDEDGGVVILGEFHGFVDFGTQRLPDTPAPPTNSYFDTGEQQWTFVLKVASTNQNMEIEWLQTIQSTSDVFAGDLARFENIIIAGITGQNITVPQRTPIEEDPLESADQAGIERAHILQFSATDGSPLWANEVFHPSGSASSLNALALDEAGNTYFTGSYIGEAEFDDISLSSSKGTDGQPPTHDVFLARLTNNSSFDLGFSTGGPTVLPDNVHSPFLDDERGTAIAVDSSGDVFVAGVVGDMAKLFGNSIISVPTPSRGTLFLAKYSPTDNLWKWGKAAELQANEGSSEEPFALPLALAVSTAGNVFLAGEFQGMLQMGLELQTSDNPDAFYLSVRSDGSVRWAESAGGDKKDVISAVQATNEQELIVAGSFHAPATFSDVLIESSFGTEDSDAFIAKVFPGKTEFSESSPEELRKQLEAFTEENPPVVSQPDPDNPSQIHITLPEIGTVYLRPDNSNSGAAQTGAAREAIRLRTGYLLKVTKKEGGRVLWTRRKLVRRNSLIVKRLQAGTYNLSYKIILKRRGKKKLYEGSENYSQPREFTFGKDGSFS